MAKRYNQGITKIRRIAQIQHLCPKRVRPAIWSTGVGKGVGIKNWATYKHFLLKAQIKWDDGLFIPFCKIKNVIWINVPRERVELTSPCEQRFLRPPRLPFRHRGIYIYDSNKRYTLCARGVIKKRHPSGMVNSPDTAIIHTRPHQLKWH